MISESYVIISDPRLAEQVSQRLGSKAGFLQAPDFRIYSFLFGLKAEIITLGKQTDVIAQFT